MADDYYPPVDEEPQQQQSQPPPEFTPYRPQESSQPPPGFTPYRPQMSAEPPPGFTPYKPQVAAPAEPAPPVKSAPPTATAEERRLIYGDEPLGTPSATGGLSPTAGSTVTSTTPVQDIPAPKVNKQGVTLPTYILRALGEGLSAIPERVTRSSGELQRQGDVYDPAPAVDVLQTLYGARALAGGLKFRPIPGAEAVRPRTAGPRITPEGQYQLPLEGTHTPQPPGPPEPVRPLQGELPLEFPSPADDALKRQGQTPGSTAAPGVAQEPNPPAAVPVADAQNKATLGTGALEKGGENLNTRDYGKTTPAATGEASGVNVLKDSVDPTVASTFKVEAPKTETPKPPAAVAPPEAPRPLPPEAPPAPQNVGEQLRAQQAARVEAEAMPKGLGLLPQHAPIYRAAQRAAPELPPETLAQIARMASGPKQAAIMAERAVNRIAERRAAPEPVMPEGTMELPTVEVKPDAAPTPESVAQATQAAAQAVTTRAAVVEHNPLDMVRRGELSAARAEELATHYKNRDKEIVDAVLGNDADAWRRAHRLSDQYWNSGYNDAKAKVQDKLVAAIEAKHPERVIDEMHRKLEQSEHTDPQGWRDFARDLRDVESSRENAVTTVGYSLRRLPEAGKALSQVDRETLALIQHALDQEAKRGGAPEPFLREAFARSSERYGGGADAAEIIAGDMERLRELLKNPPQERPALPAPRNLLTDERGGGRLPTSQNVAEAARAVGKSVAEFLKDERGGWRTKLPRTPAEEKVLSRLAPEPGLLDDVPRTRAEAASQWRKFYAGFKNEADAFEQLKHRSLTPVAPEVDPGILARQIKGLGGRINQVLEDGTYNVRTRQVTGDPLRVVMDKIAADPTGFDAYAMARTAVERAANGVKTGIDLAAARQVIAQSGAKWGPILTELNGWKGRMLDTAVDILGPQAVSAMKAKYPGHIALHRLLEPDHPTAGLLGGGMQARNPLYRLGKGNEDLLIRNVRDSTIKDGVALLDMAERNRVGMAMEDLNNKLGHNSKFMREVKDVHPIDISAAEVNRHLGTEGITEQVADGFKVFRKDAFHPSPTRIRVFRDGKSKTYEVDPELGKAYHSLDHYSFGLLTKILSVPAKMLRAGSVLIPEFIIKNLYRDQLAAFTQAKGFIPGVDTAMGMKNLFPGKSSEAFQRWQIEGGANASLVSMDRKIFHQDPRTLLQHVGNVVTSPYHFLQMMSEVAENATRLGIYERSIKQGMHPIEATYAAREGTLDFQRVGGWALQKALNQIIPFYNVALEGTDRTLRAFRDRPIATTIKTATGITIPSLYIWAATKDDERIQNMERWRKDVAWNIPGLDNWTPIASKERNEILEGMGLRLEGLDMSKLTNTFRKMPDGSWQYNRGIIWALPKPPGIGQLFGSIPERMLDAYVKHNPTAYKELGKTMWQAFSPSIVPQAFLPEIERWANKSSFLDRTLISPTLQKLPTSQQYDPHTSEVAKLVAQGIRNIAGDKTSLGAPIMVDNYIRAWSGGMGKYITDMIDAGLLRDKDAPVKPAWSASDVPILKGLVARFPSAGAQSIQQFYDTYDERKQAAAGIKNLQKKGLPEDPSLLRENPIQGIHNALGVGFKTVRNIADNKTMSAEDKRTAMDLTYLFMIEKAKQGLKALEESKRKATPPPEFTPYQPRMQ